MKNVRKPNVFQFVGRSCANTRQQHRLFNRIFRNNGVWHRQHRIVINRCYGYRKACRCRQVIRCPKQTVDTGINHVQCNSNLTKRIRNRRVTNRRGCISRNIINRQSAKNLAGRQQSKVRRGTDRHGQRSVDCVIRCNNRSGTKLSINNYGRLSGHRLSCLTGLHRNLKRRRNWICSRIHVCERHARNRNRFTNNIPASREYNRC